MGGMVGKRYWVGRTMGIRWEGPELLHGVGEKVAVGLEDVEELS